MQNPDAPQLITAIAADPRHTGRFAIVVDGQPLAVLSLEAIERLGLHVGSDIGASREALDREVATLRTYDRAVNMLAARARSARDLERHLVRKGEPPEYAKAAVERLRAAGFVDDVAFARQFVRSKGAGAGLAKRRLEQELARRGVEREVVADVIDTVLAEEGVDEAAAAEALARKRDRALGGDAATRRRRLYAFLARRGYAPDLIARTVARIIKSDPADFEDSTGP